MNFTPYVTHSISDKDPFEQRYFEPQYDMRDFEVEQFRSQRSVKRTSLGNLGMMIELIHNSEGEVVRAYEDGADIPVIVDEIQGDGVP